MLLKIENNDFVASNIRSNLKVNGRTVLWVNASTKLSGHSMLCCVLGAVFANSQFEQNEMLVLCGQLKDIGRLLHAD